MKTNPLYRNNNINTNVEDIISNFDLSIIMPFYKKMYEFKRVFPLNHKYLERNGIEVILVLDSPDEKEELIEFIKQYPFVNWRVIMNDKPHSWRNPAKPLNVGIKFASKRYIMICSPESEMLTDVPLILRKSFIDYKDYPHYAIGRVLFADNEEVTVDSFNRQITLPYGSIMVERKDVELINGYDETFSEWGGDDDNLRARLNMSGVEELLVYDAMMVHRDISNIAKNKRTHSEKKRTIQALRHYLHPAHVIANGNDWGQDFDKVIYDWKDNKYAPGQLATYLKSNFIKSECNSNKLPKSCPLLLLIQVYNEEERIVKFLNSMADIFDGFILLDDESEDDTYNLAIHEKVLVKATKRRDCFNDLENRNTLLHLASFIKYSIACYIDADELFDPRFNDLRYYLNDDADSYILPIIHIWNDNEMYNSDYPNSNNGICYRYKMFRNIGHSQIITDKVKTHFHQVPTIYCSKIADRLLIKHYGMSDKQQRENKYKFYINEDVNEDQLSYDHINPRVEPSLKNVSDINLTTLKLLP